MGHFAMLVEGAIDDVSINRALAALRKLGWTQSIGANS